MKKLFIKKYTKRYNRGVVILFAMLAIGLLIGIGVAISGLTQKQLILSSIGKQSQVAFYAADTGAECARYWDVTQNAFNKQDSDGNLLPINITCNNSTPDGLNRQVDSEQSITTFMLDLSAPSNFTPKYDYCAAVTVTKDLTTNETVIQSRGYNLPCLARYSTRKVERAIQLTY